MSGGPDQPVCKNCVYFNSRIFNGAVCQRWPKKKCLTHGQKPGREETCNHERQRTFLDLLLRNDKCGPEGKYFEAKRKRFYQPLSAPDE